MERERRKNIYFKDAMVKVWIKYVEKVHRKIPRLVIVHARLTDYVFNK